LYLSWLEKGRERQFVTTNQELVVKKMRKLPMLHIHLSYIVELQVKSAEIS